jgi:thiol-disulfide isomerase/thioredoxin
VTKRIGRNGRWLVALGAAGAVIVVMAVLYARFGSRAEDGTRPPLRGAMQNFVPQATPAPVPAIRFVDGADRERSLEEFRGRVVLLNFWATWCEPCVREMPALQRLQAALAHEPFLVLALSQDRAGLPLVQKFYREHDLDGLEMFADKTSSASRSFKLRGLPTTVLIDQDGRELGRLEGAADWDSPEALALMRHYLPKHGVPSTTSTGLPSPSGRGPG